MSFRIAAIGFGFVVAGCAGLEKPAASLVSASDFELQRGRAVAEQRCSGCHDIDQGTSSSPSNGPPFAVVRLRNTGPALERRLAAISRDGHFEMPRLQLQPDEIAALARYIESVEAP